MNKYHMTDIFITLHTWDSNPRLLTYEQTSLSTRPPRLQKEGELICPMSVIRRLNVPYISTQTSTLSR